MTTTKSRRAHLDLTPEEFERRLAAGGHGSDEIRHLWDELAPVEAEEAPERMLALGPVIAVYLGLLLVVAACVSLLSVYWHELDAGGVLALSLLFLAGSFVGSEVLRRRDLTEPAGVLEAVSVGWICLATYAVQELAGVWPEGGGGGVHRGLTTIAIVGLAAGALLLVWRPDPLLLVPIAAATALLALDLAEAVYGARIDDLSARQAATFVLPLGLGWIAGGLWLDVTGRRALATWAHWCGLLLAGAAVVAMVPKTVAGFALIGVLGAASLFFSALVRHWSYTVVGAFGVLTATIASMSLVGRLAPVLIAAVGIALVYVGLRWSRWRETIRVAALQRMPEGARDFFRRLAP